MEPTSINFSEQQLMCAVEEFMINTFGNPRELHSEAQDKWFLLDGVLSAFIREQFADAYERTIQKEKD